MARLVKWLLKWWRVPQAIQPSGEPIVEDWRVFFRSGGCL